MYGLPRNRIGLTESGGTQASARLFVALCFAYFCACVWYDWSVPTGDASKDHKKDEGREQGRMATQAALPQRPAPAETTPFAAAETPRAKSQQSRLSEWDFTKLVLLFFVVFFHMNMFVTPMVWLSRGWIGSVWYHFATVWMMSGFVFVSGVFGQSVGKSALSRVFCYTVGTSAILTGLRGFLTVATPGPSDFGLTALIWYLVCLFVWRFAVTPAFVFTRARGLPGPLFLALLTFGACLLHHVQLPGAVGGFWQYIVVFAPFFALGLLRTPAEWTTLMMEKTFLVSSVVLVLGWYGCLALWPWFRGQGAVLEVSCWTGYTDMCTDVYFPNMFTPDQMSLGSFGRDIRAYSIKAVITVAMVSVLCATFRSLHSVAPGLASRLAACGDRTLYGYLLHMLLFMIVGVRMGLVAFILPIPEIGSESLPMTAVPANFILIRLGFTQPQVSWASACGLYFLMATAVMFVWTSRLTERIFKPLIYPFWMLSCVPIGPVS